MTTTTAPTATTAATAARVNGKPDIRVLAIDLIDESPLNQRKTYDRQALQELADNITAIGLLHPVLVRPAGGRFDLAAGSRRLRATKLAKGTEILAMVREMTDAEFLILQLTENKHRNEVHPLDEAEGFKRLHGMPGYSTVRDVAAALHLKAPYVAERLKLLDLIPKAQEAFRGGQFPLGIAIALAKYSAEVQDERFAALKQRISWNQGLPSVKAFEEEIARQHHVELEKAPFQLEDAGLLKVAGSCVACPKRSGNQPDLFGDVKGTNVCTDRGCYDAKAKAHVAQVVKSAKASGEDLVQITSRYEYQAPPAGKPVPHNFTTEAKKGTPDAAHAIVVDGPEAGAERWVKLNLPNQSKRSSSRSTGRSTSESQARRKAKDAAETAFRTQLARAILGRFKGSPKPALLSALVIEMVLDHGLEHFGEALGWKLPKGYQAAAKAIRKQVFEAMAGSDAAKVVAAVLLCDELESYAGLDHFHVVAKLVDVDVSAERKRFDAARAAQTKEAAAQARAAKRVGRARPMADFMKPMTPSTQLAAVIGAKAMPRTDVTKKLWAYIKKHGLQDKKNRRMINANDALRPIFGKDAINMFDMTKKINAHLTLAVTNGKPAKRLAGDARRAKKAKAKR